MRTGGEVGMTDREKAIRILEGNYKSFVLRHNGELLTVNELIALLKAQTARVMTLSEMNDKRGRGEAVYYEDRDATCKSQDVFVVVLDKDLDVVWLKAETYALAAKMSTMGKTWRCWTERPTYEQREAKPWA